MARHILVLSYGVLGKKLFDIHSDNDFWIDGDMREQVMQSYIEHGRFYKGFVLSLLIEHLSAFLIEECVVFEDLLNPFSSSIFHLFMTTNFYSSAQTMTIGALLNLSFKLGGRSRLTKAF
jgi:hypothetical protein